MMIDRTRVLATLAVLAAIMAAPSASVGAEMKILSDEQIENKLFAKSKAISPVRRKAVDMHAVTFEFNSANLTENARAQLNVLGRVLAKPNFRGNKFVIGGHTDAVGRESYNKSLSQRRAEAVVDFLVTNYGIERSALTPVGYGESRLISNLKPEDGLQRRAEIINIGKGN